MVGVFLWCKDKRGSLRLEFLHSDTLTPDGVKAASTSSHLRRPSSWVLHHRRTPHMDPGMHGEPFDRSHKRTHPSSGQETDGGQVKRNLGTYPQQHVQETKHWPIAEDKPYCHYILGRSHVSNPFQLFLPGKINDVLPKAVVPAILVCENKEWKMNYYGDRRQPRFDRGWKIFSKENNLKIGDGMVFQLMEWSNDVIKLRVQILDGTIPAEFLETVTGYSSGAPIVIE